MAEIRVERVRKRGLGWLWALLLVLLLAAAAWYLWANGYLGARAAGPAADSTHTGLGAGRNIVTALRSVTQAGGGRSWLGSIGTT